MTDQLSEQALTDAERRTIGTMPPEKRFPTEVRLLHLQQLQSQVIKATELYERAWQLLRDCSTFLERSQEKLNAAMRGED
jgi:hypothetical protein